MPRLAPLAALVALVAFPAAAAEPIDAAWPAVARARDAATGCRIAVTGNGQAYRIAVSGLAPGSAGHFTIANGDMAPIDWTVRADAAGAFARYYLPFRWHRGGGTVSVSLTSADCAVGTAFAWRRADVRVSG